MMYGAGVEITGEMIPDVAKQPEVVQTAVDAARLLGRRLREGPDRHKGTAAM